MQTGRNAETTELHKLSLSESVKRHWPEYLIEAASLGLFMVSGGRSSRR